jgi:alkaline phosphatase
MDQPEIVDVRVSRRSILQGSSLMLLGTGLAMSPANALQAADSQRRLRIGMLSDLHYADKPPAGSRHYRETLTKIAEAGAQFAQDKPDIVVELGDLIDAAASVDAEKKYLKRINKEIEALPGDKHYVLGNHCVTTLTKDEFLEGVGQQKPHYSFDVGGVHCVVLDACFRSDGASYGRDNFQWTDANIPEEQLQWLAADLKAATAKTLVFAHQRLDVKNNYGVKNAAAVRQVLEESGKVLAVFQGHSHKNDLNDIGGIHYCTLVAMVEGSGETNSGYSLLDVFDDGSLRLSGFRKQSSYAWKPRPSG